MVDPAASLFGYTCLDCYFEQGRFTTPPSMFDCLEVSSDEHKLKKLMYYWRLNCCPTDPWPLGPMKDRWHHVEKE